MFWKIIKGFNFRGLLELSGILIKRPLLISSLYRATTDTLKICNTIYGNKHTMNTRENAFRHALWNYLICKKSRNILGSTKKAMDWAKEITDVHEKISPNKALARQMDLHNNHIGRILFQDDPDEEKITQKLIIMTEEAIKTDSIEEIRNVRTQLVFIED